MINDVNKRFNPILYRVRIDVIEENFASGKTNYRVFAHCEFLRRIHLLWGLIKFEQWVEFDSFQRDTQCVPPITPFGPFKVHPSNLPAEVEGTWEDIDLYMRGVGFEEGMRLHTYYTHPPKETV
jgi:hypothetical protein